MQKLLAVLIFVVALSNVLCGHLYGEQLTSYSGGDNSNVGDHHKLTIHHQSNDNYKSHSYPQHYVQSAPTVRHYDDHHYELSPVQTHHYDVDNHNSYKVLGVRHYAPIVNQDTHHYAPVAHHETQHYGYAPTKHYQSSHGVSTVYHVRHRPQYTHETQGHYQQPSYGHYRHY